MIETAQWVDTGERKLAAIYASKRMSALRFFFRYPIFLLAFGPPEFKPPVVGVDTSQAHFDIWNIFQVGWLSVVAVRAILRLSKAHAILIPKQVRPVLKAAFVLGLLFAISIVYSPGRVISSEYCFLYFLNLTCVVEFVVDVYSNPPNWMQCIFQLRLVALIVCAIVMLTLVVSPSLVMGVVQGSGLRLLGGTVGNMALFPEMIAIISAYTFVHALESRFRAALYFVLGIVGTSLTQTRGVEISTAVIVAVIVLKWARMSKKAAYIVVAGAMGCALVGGAVVSVTGVERLWAIFNRGQDLSGLETASGRTGVWRDQIIYCISHPQGMGYIAGVRAFHRRDFATNLHAALTNIGGTDNSYMEVLTDAGWLALALYVFVLAKTFSLGWRFAKRPYRSHFLDSGRVLHHPLRCALFLFSFCLAEGMESSMYTIPMFECFYVQNILIAMILGASATMLVASRPAPDAIAR